MKKLLSLLALASCLSAQAEMSINYECTAPDLEYVNRFEMTGTITTGDFSDNSPRSWVSTQTLEGSFTKRGTGMPSEQLSFNVNGRVSKVDTDNTLKPFINLKLKNREKTQILQLNLNYPNKLSSTIKTEDGYLYKSTCKVVSIEGCAFGSDYFDTLENPALIKEELGVVKREMQAYGSIVPVKKTRVIMPNDAEFFMYRTFDDSIDGGNTYGQIENSQGDVVARIEDSDIYQCKVKVPVAL